MSTHKAAPSPAQLNMLRPVLAAIAVVFLIFIAYEAIERYWLVDYGRETTRWFHLARGLVSSLVAAVVVGWLMHRASTSLRATTLSTSDWVEGERPRTEERNSYYALWLIQLRWIAVIVAFGLVIIVTAFGRLSEEVWWPIVATISILALLNLVYTYLTNSPALTRRLLPIQAYADLLILAVLLHLSGGIENPLWIVLVFHVAIAGIVLDRRHCYAVAAMAALLFTGVVAGEATGVLNHHLLSILPHARTDAPLRHAGHELVYVLSMIVVLTATLFLVAYFVTTLSDRIRHDEWQLAALADRAVADRQLLEQALATTETGLCVLDAGLNPLWKNDRWDAFFREVPIQAIRSALEDTGKRVIEITPDGNTPEPRDASIDPRVLQLTLGALRDAQECVDCVVLLARDITVQKQSQTKMLRAERLAALGELAGHVAHEVNNPISIISAKSRLLLSNRRSELSRIVVGELTKITNLADRIAEIVQGLLAYGRQSATIPEVLDIRDPAREAIALVQDRARHAGVQIDDRLTESLPRIRANAAELQQVFVNLLLNALDAMPDGGTVTVGARATPHEHITVAVEDNGTGIPTEIQQSVVQPFFTTKAAQKGTGLGLSVCDAVIRGYAGVMVIESVPGKGTRVSMRLPIQREQGESR